MLGAHADTLHTCSARFFHSAIKSSPGSCKSRRLGECCLRHWERRTYRTFGLLTLRPVWSTVPASHHPVGAPVRVQLRVTSRAWRKSTNTRGGATTFSAGGAKAPGADAAIRLKGQYSVSVCPSQIFSTGIGSAMQFEY